MFGRMTFSRIIHILITFSRIVFSKMTFCRKTFNRMAFEGITLSRMIFTLLQSAGHQLNNDSLNVNLLSVIHPSVFLLNVTAPTKRSRAEQNYEKIVKVIPRKIWSFQNFNKDLKNNFIASSLNGQLSMLWRHGLICQSALKCVAQTDRL